MAYSYVMDIELSRESLTEVNDIIMKISKLFRERHNADLEVYSPATGNVHRIFAILRFDNLTKFEELMKNVAGDTELRKLEQTFHGMAINTEYNLYSELC